MLSNGLGATVSVCYGLAVYVCLPVTVYACSINCDCTLLACKYLIGWDRPNAATPILYS